MKKIVILFILLTILSCSQQDEQVDSELTKALIHGNVTSVNGKSLIRADVHQKNVNDIIKSVQVNTDGSYELIINTPGYVDLEFSGVNHQAVTVPMYINPGEEKINLDVTLPVNPYIQDISGVYIIGDWNDFSFRKPDVMTAKSDGSFMFEVNADNTTISYQLLGITKNGHSVNGTMADGYKYDGGGDYRTIIEGDSNPTTIVFHPDKLPSVQKDNFPRVTFGEKHSDLQKLYTISQQLQQNIKDYNNQFEEFQKSNSNRDEFSYDFSEVKDLINGAMSKDNKKYVRQYAMIHKLILGNYDKTTTVCFSELKKLIPPSSKMWNISYNLPVLLSKNYGKPSYDYIEQIFETNQAKFTRAMALIQLIDMSQRINREDYLRLYDKLEKEYDEIEFVQYYLKKLNPDNPIQIGRKVPSFQVELMDSNEIVTDEKMRGTNYLIDFWATWCAPCRQEMPNMHKVFKKFSDENFTILSISFDRKKDDVIQYREEKWEMPWKHAFIKGGFRSDIARTFQISGIPTPILVSSDGTIIAKDIDLRGQQLDSTLEKHLLRAD